MNAAVDLSNFIGPAISGAAFAVGAWVALAVSRLETKIERARAEDRAEMQRWINGSFMRAPEIRAELAGLDRRVETAEQTLAVLHTYAHESVHDLRGQVATLQQFGCDQRVEHQA